MIPRTGFHGVGLWTLLIGQVTCFPCEVASATQQPPTHASPPNAESSTQPEPPEATLQDPNIVPAQSGLGDDEAPERDPASVTDQLDPADAAPLLDFDRRFLDHRRELLNDRATYLGRWLDVVGLVLTGFGLVIPILALLGYTRFQKLDRDARRSAEAAKKQAEKAQKEAAEATRLVRRMRSQSAELDGILLEKTAEAVSEDPTAASLAAQSTLDRPGASPLAVTVSEAIAAQQRADHESAIEKWLATAIVAERPDPKLAARAWFSVGFLREIQADLKEFSIDNYAGVLAAYDAAIQVDPEYADAYFNRGNVRSRLKRYAEAIEDCTESLRLKEAASTHYNRGNNHFALGDFEKALEDYDTALQMSKWDRAFSTEHIRHNRANALLVRGEIEKARQCLEQAIAQYPESEPLRKNYRVLEAIYKLDPRAKVRSRTKPMEDGRLRLCIDLEDSAGIASPLMQEHKANFGNVGSKGSVRMSGGKGGQGSAGMTIAPYDACGPT